MMYRSTGIRTQKAGLQAFLFACVFYLESHLNLHAICFEFGGGGGGGILGKRFTNLYCSQDILNNLDLRIWDSCWLFDLLRPLIYVCSHRLSNLNERGEVYN